MKVASLEIDLLANIARLQGDMSKAQGVVQKSMANIERNIQRVQRAFGALGLGVGFGALVGQITKMGDAWQGLENRLRLVTNGQRQLAQATGDVFAIAQRTSSGMDSVAQVYQRFAQNAGSLGLNLAQVAKLSETVSKAVAVSGASAQASDAALMQFGQALASGVLRGEEFNSIMEQTPALMQALATGMGVPLGSMRELAKEGKITGDVIVNALTKAAGAVDEQFGTRVKTVGQAFTELNNAMTKYVGQLSQSTGASSSFASAISTLSENIDGIGRALLFMAATAIPAAVRALWSLAGAMTAIPGMTLVKVLSLAAGAALAFGDKLSFLNPIFDDISNAMRSFGAVWDEIYSDASAVTTQLKDEVFALFGGVTTLSGDVSLKGWIDGTVVGLARVADVAAMVARTIGTVIYAFNAAIADTKVALAWIGRPDALSKMVAPEQSAKLEQEYQDALNNREAELKRFNASLDGLLNAQGNKYEQAAIRAVNTVRVTSESVALVDLTVATATGKLTTAIDSKKKKLTDAEKAAAAFVKEQAKELEGIYSNISAIHEQAEALEDQIATYGMSKEAIEAITIARLEEQKVMLSGMYGDKASPAVQAIEAEIEARKRLGQAIAGKERLDAEKKANEETKREWEKTVDQYGDVFRTGFADMLNNGKDGWKSFTKSLVTTFKTSVADQIYKLFAQPFVVKMVASMMGITGAGGASANQMGGGQSGGLSMDMFGGGNSTLAKGVGWLGEKFGSNAVSSFATGMGATSFSLAGASSAVPSLAGLTAGPGMAASLGSGTAGAVGAGVSTGAMAAGASAMSYLPYVGALFAASQGQYLTAAGAAIGSLIPGIGTAIGAAVGALADMFVGDRFAGESRHGGSYNWTADRGAVERGKWDDGNPGEEANKAIGSILDSAVTTINAAFKGVGSDAGLSYFMGWAESSEKGRGGTASGGRLAIDGKEVAFGTTRKGQGHGDTSGDLGEMVDNLAVDTYQTIIQAWQAGITEFPPMIQGMIRGIDADALTAEQAQGVVSQVAATIDSVNQMRAAFDLLPFESLKNLSFDATASLLAFGGGVESFTASLGNYYANFYSQEEQFAAKSADFATALSSIGITMPELTGSAADAKAAFRAIVDSFDVTTEAGQRQYATMIGLSGTFAELTGVMEQLNAASAQASAAMRQAAIDAKRAALDIQIAMRGAAESAGSSAIAALTRAVESSKSALQKAFDGIAESLNTSISASRTSIGTLESMAGRLRSTLDTMRGQSDDAQSRSWAQAQIAQARAAGVAPSGANFEQALQIVAQPSSNLFSTFEDYQTDFLKTANDIFALSEVTDKQLTVEQRTLAALEDQLKAEQANFDKSMASYDAMIATAQRQLDVAMGIDDKMLTIPQALEKVAEAILAMAETAAAGYMSRNPDVAAAYTNGGFGDTADAAAAAHYAQYGALEGRGQGGIKLSPEQQYIANNPDLGKYYNAHSTEYASLEEYARIHYAMFGKNEGRSFAVGTNYVPYDMQANIHEGERIIPKADNRALMAALSNPGANNAVLVAEIRALREEVAGLRGEQKASQFAIAKSTGKTAKNTDYLERWDVDGLPGSVGADTDKTLLEV